MSLRRVGQKSGMRRTCKTPSTNTGTYFDKRLAREHDENQEDDISYISLLSNTSGEEEGIVGGGSERGR